jgi:putative ABC transport system permease protein
VGVCETSPTFQTFPIVYTTYNRAVRYAAQGRRSLSFVLAKAEAGESPEEVCNRIEEQTGLMALSQTGFTWRTIRYYMERTGIPVNFGITVLLGFIIGALKAMGVSNLRIIGMVLLQGLLVGTLGYMIGLGMACAFGEILAWKLKGSGIPLADNMVWQIPIGTAIAAALIVVATSMVSLGRVLRLEPASVFR